jgi:hypothetical protein
MRTSADIIKSLRYKLLWTFRDTGYPQYEDTTSFYNGKTNPHFININNYCKTHWGKYISEMDKKELEKYINIVKRWKKPENKEPNHN